MARPLNTEPERPPAPKKPQNWLESLNCAVEGIIYAFKTQRHMRYHYLIAAGALFLSLFFKLPLVEFVLFAISIIILLAAEMLNTAIEETVNLVEERHHITARNAKDVSAGAVLISSTGVALMGYVIFSRYLYYPSGDLLVGAKKVSAHIAIISLLIVCIGVVASKAFFGRGRPFHGGMPSGHAAVAFSLWTSVALLTLDPLVAILTFIMAVMVSHSRLLGKVHTRLEVFLGALLGAGITLAVYYVFTSLLAGVTG
ncbi:MAG: diacylglycerol kinase [Deltaproteobacteria bacterium]|nr:diacylglycerol kinase [Deltaproteobacteria bacterium]